MVRSQAGKVVVVTGGNSGMGFSTAKLFASEGAHVFITGRDQKTLDRALSELGPNAKGIVSDASKLSDISKLAETLKQNYKHIDTLFANAGIGGFVPFKEATEEHFDSVFNTNVKGPYFLIQKLLPILGKGSSVIINASVVAHLGFPNATVYSASKAAVLNLVKTLTTDLLPLGIRVNAVSPGPIETPIFGRSGATEAEVKAMKEGLSSQVPMGRIGAPEEIARTVFFLGTEASSFIAGGEIIVDGGLTKH